MLIAFDVDFVSKQIQALFIVNSALSQMYRELLNGDMFILHILLARSSSCDVLYIHPSI